MKKRAISDISSSAGATDPLADSLADFEEELKVATATKTVSASK